MFTVGHETALHVFTVGHETACLQLGMRLHVYSWA